MDSILGMFTKRNVFDMSHERKLSCDMGNLIPIMCEEILPGDTFKVKTDMLVRISPLIAPVMHRVNCFTHYFFVPNRLIWADWEKFITGDTTGTDATVAPTINFASGVLANTLADYFGIPLNYINNVTTVSALPFRAYALIYNEWFRDQNLQTKLVMSTASGADTTTSVLLMNRNWEKDYFTSALPWPQRGTAVNMPMGTSAPVDVALPQQDLDTFVRKNTPPDVTMGVGAGAGGYAYAVTGQVDSAGDPLIADLPHQHLTGTADLANATAPTINALRQAFQVQKWMERNARAGVRYVESILAHFGVKSSDARLQRPEFLGGGRSQIVISEVLQTSETNVTSPQGTMAGHAYSALRSHEFKKSFEEHGFIIGLMSIMPRTAYQQGLPRLWTRATRYDYYWPEFAHLGEQAVLMKEIYFNATSPQYNDNVFGYQGRYDEYRRRESTVHADFKDTLKFWHMGRIFAGAPALNSAFVTSDPTKRINAVTSYHNCWIQLYNDVQAIRPIPKIGEPGLIDHN